jgi:phosphate transport system permease protein
LKTNFKQIKEKVIEGVLMLSSATSITVILIFFLFIEGAGVLLENLLIKGFIGSKWVKSVNRLEPSQIKDVLIKKSQIE